MNSPSQTVCMYLLNIVSVFTLHITDGITCTIKESTVTVIANLICKNCKQKP